GRRPATPLLALAGTWSGLVTVLGLWWWIAGGYPFGPADPWGEGTALGVLPAAVGPPLLVGFGLVGLVVAVTAIGRARRDPQPAGAVPVVVTGVVHAVAFLLLAPGLSLLVLAGYLMAALGPVVLLATLLAGARRSRSAAVAATVLVLLGIAAWATGVAGGDVVAGWATAFTTGLAEQATRMLILLFLAAGGAVWAGLAWVSVRGSATGGPPAAWTRPAAAARWGRVATVIATLCALPYVLVRVTWLTPWPLGVPPGTEDAVVGAMRLQGLLLGGAALAGAVLTTGLVARWGEVWPRWMPGLRGRPVPVAAAVVPATLVAVLLSSAAVPMAVLAVELGELLMLLMFPLPVWGPALGIAALGYALRRTGDRERAGTIEGS
ncbi:MAG TPA: hypothetical protein VEZ42_11045, partial [Pseudonocardia sp.]|nr:hypothetical protein [Pseudonocardia sp.]